MLVSPDNAAPCTKEMNMSRFTLFGTLAFQNRPHCLHPLRAAAALLPISAVICPFAFKQGPRRRASEQATPRSPPFLSISPLVAAFAPSPSIAMTFAVLLRVQSMRHSSNECALFIVKTTSATDGVAAKIWILLISSIKVAQHRSTTLREGSHGLTASSQSAAATGPPLGCSSR